MGLFENKKFTIITISLLAILNVALVSVIVLHQVNRGGERKTNDRSRFFTERLDFTDEQIEQYDSLNAIHKEERNRFQRQINSTRRQFFRLSHSANFSSEQADSLTSEIGLLVSKMELNSFNYISGVRAICTPEQLNKLDTYLQERMRPKGSESDNKKSRERSPH